MFPSAGMSVNVNAANAGERQDRSTISNKIRRIVVYRKVDWDNDAVNGCPVDDCHAKDSVIENRETVTGTFKKIRTTTEDPAEMSPKETGKELATDMAPLPVS